jgi:arginine repressor
MKIQQLCDELTMLCHNGHAQADVKFVSGTLIKNVAGIEMIGDDTVLIVSEFNKAAKKILEKEND